MKEIKLGTIGSGIIVHNILKNVIRIDGIRLEAVYSRQEEKGRALAQEFGTEKVYTDMTRFLQDPDINTVYIASPNLLHFEQTKAALQAGKHVLCEKPFCLRAEQAEELMHLAEEQGLILAEAAPTSFLPNYRLLQQELSRVGRVRLVMANYSQLSSRYHDLKAGKLTNVFDPAFGGGCLMDINFYNLYLTVALFGLPESGIYYPNRYANGVDTSGTVQLLYPDFQVSLAGAKDTRGVNYYQIEGEEGYIYVTDGSNGLREIRVSAGGEEQILNLQPDPDRYFYEIREITELMLADQVQAFRDRMQITRKTIQLMEQLRRDAGLLFPGDK